MNDWKGIVLALAAAAICACSEGKHEAPDVDAEADAPAEDLRIEETAEETGGEEAEEEGDTADLDGEEEIVEPSGFCRACTYDADCGPGGACLDLGDGELSCGMPCEVPTDCPPDAGCENVPESEIRQCVPESGTCVWDPMGSACRSWGCSGRNDLCSDPAGSEEGYCTHACWSRVDCEAGYMQCADRGDGIDVCLKDPADPASRCGSTEHPSGVGSPCEGETCAAGGLVCASTLAASLPGLCVKPCEDEEDCPTEEGSRCVALQGLAAADRYCVPDECSCLGVVPGSLFDGLLEGAGMTRCDLRWEEEIVADMFGASIAHDRFRIPWTDDVHDDWLRALPVTRNIESELDAAAAAGSSELVRRAAELAGFPIGDCADSFEPDPGAPLVTAMTRLLTVLGEVPDLPGIEADADDVPADVQMFAARVLMAITAAVQARGEALAVLGGDDWEINRYYTRAPSLVLSTSGSPLDVTSRRTQDFLIGDLDYPLLYQAACAIAAVVERHAADVAVHPSDERFEFSQPTTAGRVEISDGRDTTYAGSLATSDYLFVLDAGGADTYEISAGGTTSADNPVSVLVDIGGADAYGYTVVPDPEDGDRLPSDAAGRATPTADYGPFTLSTTPRQGSGRLGIGMLFDLGGMDDRYRSLRMSQGSGILGVGLLLDDGGSDVYECEAACQGSAIFGVGLLVDAGPQGAEPGDTFESYHASQGFAYAGAAGILYNVEGSDGYLCEQDDILYPSPQSSITNSSLCQGMGFGRRADIELGGDGVFMSGGVGILRDLAGDDGYRAGVFGQGSGYWYGLGFLLEGGGADTYDARYYVQGATAHFATSVLHDAGGDDVYNQGETTRIYGTLGAGHDISNSFLVDDAGIDTYLSPGRSLGTGNDSAFGIIVDRAGDDAYQCDTDYSFGNALLSPEIAMWRDALPNVGMFLDCGGTDTYDRPDPSILGNDTTWRQKMHPDDTTETGLGGDTSTLPCGL